jgi:hypothetical protein
MIFSSDELGILEYLKSWKGVSISLTEICRSAAGRQKFKEEPNWANSLLARLVEEGFAAVNERGHYRYTGKDENPVVTRKAPAPAQSPTPERPSAIVNGDYFPAQGPSEAPEESGTEFYFSPEIREILRKSGKKFGA